jgi:isoquinoline 1-oxidoreductase subunit beta
MSGGNLKVTRRAFIRTGAAAAGGLLVGFYLPGKGEVLAAEPNDAGPKLNAFIRIGSDDIVTLIIHKPENGQGTVTSLSMLLAEELECDWQKIRWEFAPVDRVYGFPLQGTVGSQGVRTSWQPLRTAGATAREMLIQAAAEKWGVAKSQCRGQNSAVVNSATQARLSYGSLADAAAKLTPPANVTLKQPAEFRLIGKPMKRLDTPSKINGQAKFGIDVRQAGMLYAVVARCPVFGGKVASFEAGKAKAVPGVRHVIQIPHGIAVVADNTWAAMQGRRALQIQWDEGSNANLTSAEIRQIFAGLVEKPGAVARTVGEADAALAGAPKRLEAVYEAPYLAHAPMEPHTCVAHVTADGCEVWMGTQLPSATRDSAVRASGLAPEKVQVHTMYIGGGFGSKGGGASVEEAVTIAKAAGVPINLTYTREDDIQHDRYRPAAMIKFSAALGPNGLPTAWIARATCSSFSQGGLRNGVDREGVAGVADILYDIPNVHVEYHEPGLTIPTNYWRSVGHSQNTFFSEGFIDELAVAARVDPVEFRRRLLAKAPRLQGVLDLAAEKAGWGKPLPEGRYQGVAAVNCFGSFNAQVAEISISQGKVRVHRVVCAVDCGQVVNPTGVVQQMQSAIVYGLSAALRGNITIDRGRVQQSNFHQYEPLRIDEMPVVEVHFVPSTSPLGGIGEVGTPAIAPAVTNAIFAATKKRIRRLPISLENLAG